MKVFPDSSFPLGSFRFFYSGGVPGAAKVIKQLEVILTDRAD
jgi:hypothetical protein